MKKLKYKLLEVWYWLEDTYKKYVNVIVIWLLAVALLSLMGLRAVDQIIQAEGLEHYFYGPNWKK